MSLLLALRKVTMNPVPAPRRPLPAGVRPLIVAGVLLMSASSQACDTDEMIAQMRSACTEMIVGYQKAVGKPLATAAAQGHLAQARAHCQALEFDKAGLKLALAAQLSNSVK
jgi:hypothetical protein